MSTAQKVGLINTLSLQWLVQLANFLSTRLETSDMFLTWRSRIWTVNYNLKSDERRADSYKRKVIRISINQRIHF